MTGENATHGDWRSLWPLFVRGRFVGRDLRASRETLESGAYFDRQSVKRRETSSFYALAETRGGAAIVPKKKKKTDRRFGRKRGKLLKNTMPRTAGAGREAQQRCVGKGGEREESHGSRKLCGVQIRQTESTHPVVSHAPPGYGKF